MTAADEPLGDDDLEGLIKAIREAPLEIPVDPAAALPPAPPPEFRHEVIDEVVAATGGQVFNCLCMACPLAHWEITWATDTPPPPDTALAPPSAPGGKSDGDAGKWGLEAHCRSRHAIVAKYEASKDAPGKLTRAMGANGNRFGVVGKCSDQKEAVERWQAEHS